MAKLEIENRAFSDPRLKMLARLCRIRNPLHALGLLAGLWHDSQERGREVATPDEIDAWLGLKGAHAGKVRQALIDSGYLAVVDGGLRVCGNSHRIEIINSRRKCARMNAKQRWSKFAAKHDKAAKAKDENTDSWPGDIDAPGNAMAMLRGREIERERGREGERREASPSEKASAVRAAPPISPLEVATSACEAAADAWDWPEEKAGDSNPEPMGSQRRQVKTQKAAKQATGANLVVAAYKRAYREKFSAEAELVGSELGAAKRLAIDLGPERACDLVSSYVKMNDEWFIRQEYRLAVLLQNIKKVGLFHDKGIAITHQMARAIGTEANNQAVAARVIERLKNRDEGVKEASGDW